MPDNIVPCTQKLSLLNAFCSKVRELHFASRHMAALVVSNADAMEITSAKIRCQTLRGESDGIQKRYDQHDSNCPSCRDITRGYRAKHFKASA